MRAEDLSLEFPRIVRQGDDPDPRSWWRSQPAEAPPRPCPPKLRNSIRQDFQRTFILPRRTIDHLRAHRHDQNKRRVGLGPAWRDGWNVVCDAGDGGPIDPDSFTGAFKRLSTAAGHASVRLHDMRHSAATTMLRQGVNPALVSSVLGHSDVGFTLTTYSHVDADTTSVAADALDRAFGDTGTED